MHRLRIKPTDARGDDGFTLVEVLVAMVLGMIVIGAGVMMFTASVRSQPGVSSRQEQIQNARATMERITRELRQGSTVSTGASNQLALVTYVNSATCGGSSSTTAIPCRVAYTCTAGTCTRVEARPDGSGPGPARTVVTGLSSSDVFTYSPSSTSPTYVGVTLAFPAQGGDDAITLQDGVALRNVVSP